MSKKLTAPKWCAHAVPTRRGWEDPNTGELFVSTKFSFEDLTTFYGKRVEENEELDRIPDLYDETEEHDESE